MRKRFLLVGALVTTLTLGGFFAPRLVNAATPTTQVKVENNENNENNDDYYVLPNGDYFLTKRTLKNGKLLEFFDLETYGNGKGLTGKLRYDGEEFQLDNYSLELQKGEIQNIGYDPLDESTQKFSPYANPETYFPALTATKKVNDLIQKYKDPNKSTLPSNVDKTSELYLDMKSCADEAIKDCTTDYEKIVTLDKYVHKTMTRDIKYKGLSLEQAWKQKTGACMQFSMVLERLCQIEGISSDCISSSSHMCVLSYDSQNKRWILSDPLNFCEDFDVYSWANQQDMVFYCYNFKLGDSYLSLNYNNKSEDSWDEMENWSLKLSDTASPNVNLTQTELDGIPITEVSSDFCKNNTEIKSVTLPSSITDVSGYAFWNCTNLEEVDLSQTKITSIPSGLFKGCTSLKTIKLPSTITSIGDEAFHNCQSLKNIEGLDKCKIASIGTKAFYNCNKLESLDFSQATFTSMEDEMFYGLTGLKNITFPETLTSIGKKAFYYDTSLTNVAFPSSLTTIGESAFESCKKLESVDMSKTKVTELSNAAFYNCSSLTSITFPNSLTSIGDHALYKCISLAKLDLYDTSLTTIGEFAIANTPELTQIALPDSISTIGKKAFNSTLTNDLIPTAVSDNVMDKISYTEDNVEPWQGRAVEFYDKDDLGKVKAIRFYGNGSESGTPVAPFFYIGSSVRMYIPKCTFKRSGYIFTGWNSMPDGSGRSYKENAAAVNPPEKLYAQWKQSRITVNFVFPGGTMEKYGETYTDSSKLIHTFSSASSPAWTLPNASNMSKPYYKFLAWYKEEDFSGKPIIQITLDTAEDMTLYAKWIIDPNHTHEWENGECTLCHRVCDHSNFSLEGEKEATCKEEGYSGDKICSDCGLTIETGHTIDKTNVHKWDEGKVTKEATCKDEGEILYTCTVCGETKADTLAKTDNHQWSDWTVDTPSTCTTKGTESRTCTICSKSETESLPLAQHTPATINAKKATCTEDGYTGDKECTVCHTIIEKGKDIPATGHKWKDWVIKKQETCTEDGEKIHECETCGETEPEVIPATGHDPELKNQKDSTCTTHGYSGDEVCKNCGETLKSGHELPLAPHTPKKEEGVDATCTEDGHEGNTVCEVCGATIATGKTLSKLGHDWANEKGECTRCGENHEHSFGDGKTITELTCTQDGEIDYECSECGYVKKEITQATGHQWGEWETTLAQNCTTDGKQVRKCSKCTETEIQTLKATGHKPETVRAKVATCKEEGYTGDEECEICHETLSKGTTIPKTDSHQWGEWTITRESTCDKKGEESRTCTICGKEETKSLPLAQHVWNNGVITKAPSYKATGIKTWTCKNCGATKTTTLAKLAMPKAGTKVTVGGNTYVVTRAGAEVRFSKANNKAKAITIPSTISAKGITYKVTSIGANAFNNCKKLTTVTIGANVKSIAAKAFNNCPKLKKVTIKTVVLSKKTAGKKCFSKVNKKMVIKVPKKVKKVYAVIFKDLKVQ